MNFICKRATSQKIALMTEVRKWMTMIVLPVGAAIIVLKNKDLIKDIINR